ncbi:hypothetical protein MACK_000699 [Theileria orientalis]|uniref:AP complex subunit beta n=1 Tax=Theileria orientalis TaxID=68886 RepID=A0A976MCJ6_THEOR|nr:hypothetical protein MACK_000699 [Theileria orientalis]
MAVYNSDRIPMPPVRKKVTYFADNRKGEVGELRLLLRKMLLDSNTLSTTEKIVSQIVDPNIDHIKALNMKRRDILKRLIGTMTMGIDLSSLYTDVVMVSQTDDPVQKKMIYLYLSNYSMNNPDLAVLAINTLLKDIESVDPVIRSLALRNLSSFGTNLSNEYATVSVLKKMFDPSDSVKRTAIIGSIRIYKSNCTVYGNDSKNTFDLLQDLKMALRSKNVHVMLDSMCAVSEIADYEWKIPLSTRTVIYLTNCLKNMDEWEQCSVLELLWTYKPADREEMFDLMNLLDDKLRHNSSAMFLATAKCFLMWTKNELFLQLEVVRRLQDPFISLINRSRNEISYVLLVNILCLIVNVTQLLLDNPGFEDEENSISNYDIPFVEYYELFYCHYDDPTYIKNVKINILLSICTEKNCVNIIRELNEYVSESNHDIANKSIIALGIVALKLPDQLPFLIKQIKDIYNFNLPHLNASVLYVVRTLFAVYPECSSDLLEIVKDPSEVITYPEAKAHHIAILGDYGCDLDHTPYTLEDYIDDPNRTDTMTLELLPASIKVFLKRPAEMHEAMARLFQSVLYVSKNPDLLSSADYYYNLLLLGPEEAKKVLFENDNYRQKPDKEFLLGQQNYFAADPDWREHFNTVHLMESCQGFYSSKNPKYFFPFEHKNVPTDIFRDENIRKAVEEYSPRSVEVQIPTGTLIRQSTSMSNEDMVLVNELETEIKYFNLVNPSTIMSEEFQKIWFETENAYSSEMPAHPSEFSLDDLEVIFSTLHVITLVSGTSKDVTRFYMYTEDKQGLVYYIEILVTRGDEGNNGFVKVTVKVTEHNCNESSLQSFAEILCDFVNRWVNR